MLFNAASNRQALLLDDTFIRARDQERVANLRQRRGWWSRVLLAIALVGPGLLVMIADNDAGGVITYAQTGALYGLGFYLPFLVLLGPLAYFVQEMTVRLGAVTGRGHAELIWGRYGRFWGAFSLIDLVLANGLTLVTEFVGITLGLAIFGVPAVWGAVAGVVIVGGVLTGLKYYTWERVALAIAAGNLVFVPLALMARPHWAGIARAFGTWNIPGGLTPAFLFLLIANVGTTIAPWQLFFQQSSVVDKGLTVRDIRAGQIDTALGSAATVTVALAIVILTGTWIHGLPGVSRQMGVGQLLAVLGNRIGPWGEKLFALGLVEAGVIAAIAITASTSWATGEALNWPKSINLPFRAAWRFYLPGLASVVLAAAIVLIPRVPLGFLNLTVQVVATIFMPAALLFLLLLLNDRELLGIHVNKPWQNWVAGVIVGALVVVNGIYGLTVVFPHGLHGL